jgi:hypothetical protein
MLESLSLFEWNVAEHCFGKKTAMIPSTQMASKVEPIIGLRHGKLSCVIGGLNASIIVRKRLKSEMLIMNSRSGVRSRL